MVLTPFISLSVWRQFSRIIWIVHILISCLGGVISEPVYLNKFAVHLKGGHKEADRVARSAGLHNLGQVSSIYQKFFDNS